jgi:hypothetical protein
MHGQSRIMTIAGLWEAGQGPTAAMAEGAQPHEPPAKGPLPERAGPHGFFQFVQNGNGPAWLGQQVTSIVRAAASAARFI